MSLNADIPPEQSAPNPAKTSVVLASPESVAAAIPYLVGFVPLDSLVLVFIDASSASLAVTMRIDLTSDGFGDTVAAPYLCDMARAANHAGADAVLVFAFTGLHPRCSASRECFVGQAIRLLAGQGMKVLAGGYVSEQHLRAHVDCGDDSAPSLRALSAGIGLATEFDFVLAGASHLSSRAQLVELVRGSADTDMATVADHARAFRRSVSSGSADYRSQTIRRRRAEDAIVNYISATPDPTCPGAKPRESQVAQWLVALADCRVREPVLRRAASPRSMTPGHGAGVLHRMAWVVRQAPDTELAPAAACLAALAWQHGNGALAVIAAERALECDDLNVLADLVRRAVQAGMPPRAWLELIRAVPLRSLRSGVSHTG